MSTTISFILLFWVLFVVIFAVFGLILPMVIGVMVYQDATKRGNPSAFIWAMVASLVPAYIGLLLYVLIGTTQNQIGDKQ